ncbi:MAG TPA: ATP-binding protein, partial [Roseiflexaceae bacterium]|nr:ATP-binding protein [Roseiflexaceae bacterium]
AERTAELEAVNKELEAFAYSVSHDLRAPLRAIAGYTTILEEDYAELLDAEGRQICDVVRQEVQHMSQLINDLLALSRAGRAELHLAPVDMAALVASIWQRLTSPEERQRLRFELGTMPPALADPRLIQQVWQNLIENAVKFSSASATGTISVGGRLTDQDVLYQIQDTGAGFDMRYANKLFGVFQRLHSEREFGGTGVGLAIVQRVVSRHGGRVWAEGMVGAGATFYFSLPRRGEET